VHILDHLPGVSPLLVTAYRPVLPRLPLAYG